MNRMIFQLVLRPAGGLPLLRAAAVAPLVVFRASFMTTALAMAEGDTGAPPKMGGLGDAFQRRERASEDMAIREREREKVLDLRRRLAEQKEHIISMEKHIEEMTKTWDEEDNK